MTSIPNTKKKYRVRFKQNEQDELQAISAHYLRVSGNREKVCETLGGMEILK